jgi:hypothetical protein
MTPDISYTPRTPMIDTIPQSCTIPVVVRHTVRPSFSATGVGIVLTAQFFSGGVR